VAGAAALLSLLPQPANKPLHKRMIASKKMLFLLISRKTSLYSLALPMKKQPPSCVFV
jgi:hypothetical protein